MNSPDPAAMAAATAVADAIADPRNVRFAAEDGRVRPQSLAGGAAGIALLHIELLRSGHGDEKTTHTWLSLAASEPVSAGYNATLFHGAPALGFVLHTAAATTSRYRHALTTLDDKILAITQERLTAAHARIDRGDRLPMHEFDLVHGLTGLGVYHLNRHPDHPITRDVLDYLVRLTSPLRFIDAVPGDNLPPWWLLAGLNGQPDPKQYPHGHGNLGVAHGISAVITLLSLAILKDLPVPGSRDALAELCAWTDQWRQHTGSSTWWPGYLTIDHAQPRKGERPLRPRPSWCYGIAGTARAQQLAGIALADTERRHTAETAMLTALRDPDQRALLPDIGLCHGKAGLLQAGWRMAIDAQRPQHLAAALTDLAAELENQMSGPIANPELMDGAAGAALALHTAGTGTAPASRWDAFLLQV